MHISISPDKDVRPRLKALAEEKRREENRVSDKRRAIGIYIRIDLASEKEI